MYDWSMAHQKSYTITKSNNATEKEALNYLLQKDSHFILPDKESRKSLMKLFDIDKRFSRAFDLLHVDTIIQGDSITIKDKDAVTFIELKTTKKYLPNNPRGFFFGATKNEFDLAQQLGDKYKFCFVSLHEDSLSSELLTLEGLGELIRTKRIQYQINLKQ